LLKPVGVRVKGLVSRLDFRQRQENEFTGCFAFEKTLALIVDDRQVDAALKECTGTHTGARNVAYVAILNAVFLGHPLHDRFRTRSTAVNGNVGTVKVGPFLVLFSVCNWIKAQHGKLVEHADRRVDALDQAIGRANADIRVAAHNSLCSKIFRFQEESFDVDAALLGAFNGDHEVCHFTAGNVAECNFHGSLVLSHGAHAQANRQSGQQCHLFD